MISSFRLSISKWIEDARYSTRGRWVMLLICVVSVFVSQRREFDFLRELNVQQPPPKVSEHNAMTKGNATVFSSTPGANVAVGRNQTWSKERMPVTSSIAIADVNVERNKTLPQAFVTATSSTPIANVKVEGNQTLPQAYVAVTSSTSSTQIANVKVEGNKTLPQAYVTVNSSTPIANVKVEGNKTLPEAYVTTTASIPDENANIVGNKTMSETQVTATSSAQYLKVVNNTFTSNNTASEVHQLTGNVSSHLTENTSKSALSIPHENKNASSHLLLNASFTVPSLQGDQYTNDSASCITNITNNHCPGPCSNFQHCSDECNTAALKRIPFTCRYNSKPPTEDDHRRIIFVGDSISLQFFDGLSRRFAENGANIEKLYAPPPLYCRISSENRTVCFVQTGRAAGMERIQRDATGNVNQTDCRRRTNEEFWNVDLGDTLECMSEGGLLESQDIIVVNTGLHHPEASSLNENTEDFISWLKETTKSRDDLCVVWRQTLPQHFPTKTGAYKAAHMRSADEAIATAKAANTSCCAPLKSLIDSQLFNAVTDPLIERAGIPNIKLFPFMTGLWKYHMDCTEKTVDCTHWVDPAIDLATTLLLKGLDDACPLQKGTSKEVYT